MENIPFTAIKSPYFRRIFEDLPGVALPFQSRKTISRRIETDFQAQRAKLIEDLASTCRSISLSLDVWTSKNSKAILSIIDHLLTVDFECRDVNLEFKELFGVHSGENMAEALHKTLKELNLESKFFTITGVNASNNEILISELYFRLKKRYSVAASTSSGVKSIRFSGLYSYIRCLAHILNLIVKDILATLKTGDHQSATTACDLLQNKQGVGHHSTMSRLRILALWKFIVYDVDTRWNSTYRMLQDAIKARPQIEHWIDLQSLFPPFKASDWHFMQQVSNFLEKFEEFTLTTSQRSPQITLA
ncbi:putative AC transposase, partial [Golovinomyces cichoracearum]